MQAWTHTQDWGRVGAGRGGEVMALGLGLGPAARQEVPVGQDGCCGRTGAWGDMGLPCSTRPFQGCPDASPTFRSRLAMLASGEERAQWGSWGHGASHTPSLEGAASCPGVGHATPALVKVPSSHRRPAVLGGLLAVSLGSDQGP